MQKPTQMPEDGATRARKKRGRPQKYHTPLSIQRRNVFIIDGRPLDKVKDFRFRESKFKMKVFDPLESVDTKYQFAPPHFKHWAKLRDQEALRLRLLGEISAARLQAGLETYSRSSFDHAEDAERIERTPPQLTPTARPNVSTSSLDPASIADPRMRPLHPAHKNAVWYGLTKPVPSSMRVALP